MNLKPLAAASCCLLALSAMACEERKEEPWKQNVLAAEIRLPRTGQPAVARLSKLLEQAGSTPGVKAVAVVDVLPGRATSRRKSFYAIRREGAPGQASTAVLVQGISPGYFATMEIRLIRGRLFSQGDIETSVPVAIVSESCAKKSWPGEDPLGRRLRIHDAEPWTTIVGMVQDGPNTEGMPEVYLPYTQYGVHGPYPIQVFSWFLLARAAGDPKTVAPALQQTVGQEFRNLKAWLKSREAD
jgi:putative ABC transport system permease protein